MKSKLALLFLLPALMQINAAAQKSTKTAFPVLPFASLEAFTASVKENLPRANSEAFIKPSAEDRAIFQKAIAQLLGGNLTAAAKSAAAVNYDLVQLKDLTNRRTYWILRERAANFRGLGTYVVDPVYRRNLVIHVTHPIFDLHTLEQGTAVFRETGARALFISGTHRCANTEAAPCDGTSSVCGKPSQAYKISDVAHYTENFFQEAHRATLNLRSKPVAVSLHGNVQKSLPDFTLSDGTEIKSSDETPVNRLRRELKNRKASAGSCNSAADTGLSLCGTTNAQGRLSNGAADACKAEAVRSSGLFLHIEQKSNVRENPQVLIEALNAVFPVVN